MFVYKAEREAGLADPLRKPAPVALAARAEPVARRDLPGRASPPEGGRPRAVASVADDDLFWFRSLLVSTGFNDNDHFFDRAEVWAARHTPEDKPINVGHVQHDIVGHMVGSHAVDDARVPVPDDTAPDELPESFHLVDPGVLYARWEDPALQERIDKAIADLKAGKLSVSMEVWYKSFDYVLEAADGTREVVARSKQTAGMTQHLRQFGGSGKVDGRRLGMLLRGLTFAGKGLVTDPANPHSEVLETAETAAPPAAAAGYPPTTPRERPMTDDTDWKAKAAELGQLNQTLQSQLDDAVAKLKAAADSLSAANDELARVRADAQKAARLDAVSAALGLPATDDGRAAAAKYLDPIAGLPDDAFKAVLKNQADILAAAQAPASRPLAELAPGKADAALLDGVKPDAALGLAVPAGSAEFNKVVDDVVKHIKQTANLTKGK